MAERAACGHSVGLGSIEHCEVRVTRGNGSFFGSKEGVWSFKLSPMFVMKVL